MDVPSAVKDRLRNALSSNNESVIKVAYERVLAHYSYEIDRGKTLDTKAVGLFAVMALIFGPGLAVLRSSPTEWVWLSTFLLVSTLGILAMSMAASRYLYFAVKIQVVKAAPSEDALFLGIAQYDGHGTSNGNSPREYLRHLTEHYWCLYLELFKANEEKATQVGKAQGYFFVAALTLVLVSILIFGVSYVA